MNLEEILKIYLTINWHCCFSPSNLIVLATGLIQGSKGYILPYIE